MTKVKILLKSVVLFSSISLFMLALTSCTKNEDYYGPREVNPTVPVPESNRVLVLNEGNFMWANSSLSVLDIEENTVANEVFSGKNSVPLGDVAQSMIVHDSLGYIVVNNSGKIVVVNMGDFSMVKTISGFTSPRFMEIVSEEPLLAWVTDLYANKIWEVNLETGTIISEIPGTGWNETMLAHHHQMLVLNKTDSVINVWDIKTHQFLKTYSSSSGIADFKRWNENEILYVTTSGIFSLDLTTDVVSTQFLFASERTPVRMGVDTILNELYFLDGSLFKYALDKPGNGVEEVLVNGAGSSLYGLQVNSKKGLVFVTDAKDYVQPGECMMFPTDFSSKTSFTVGVNPQYIYVE